jgi:hypothetical protein
MAVTPTPNVQAGKSRARRISPPNLSSPLAVQGDSGELAAGSARLITGPQQAWLIVQQLDPADAHG